MAKRQERDELNKKGLNLLKPIDITVLGTNDDPCFGKYNDPQAPECQICGDCEICAIVTSQLQHLRRDEIEQEEVFKDIEDLPKPKKAPSVYRKYIKRKVEKGVYGKKLIERLLTAYPELSEKKANRLATKYEDRYREPI